MTIKKTKEKRSIELRNLHTAEGSMHIEGYAAVFNSPVVLWKHEGIVDTIEAMNEAGTADIDIKALKIELKANYFYRGNDYVDQIGTILGFTSTQLDNFFETGDYTYLTADREETDTAQAAGKEESTIET